MSNTRMRSLIAAAVAALLTGAVAGALYKVTAAPAATPSNLPLEKTQGEVMYLSGGISKAQEAAIRHVAAQYPLELMFSQGGSAPAMKIVLANIPVTIKDHAGKVVLDARTDGPLMLAKLPDGRYAISAESVGRTETRMVDIGHGKHETVVFNW